MSGTVKVNRRSRRTLRNEFDSLVQFRKESLRRSIVPIAIPPVCLLRFQDGCWMNFDRPRHYRPEILVRASDHGIGRTALESRSRNRRPISASHAASESGSTSWSRLSRRAPASAALPSGGSLSASFKRLLGSCFIAIYYTAGVATFNRTKRCSFV